ncbi:MAG: alcohol dehydrogenase catalytic domain-containing protein [Acidimicrobiales bacterium]
MQAWRVHAPGEPRHVLQLDEVEVPEPGPDQALVEVEAAGINFADVLLCRGGYQERPPHPFTPGLEVAGRVLALGPRDRADVPQLEVGERVVAATALPAGGFAQRALVPVAQAHPIPDELPADVAAATHVTYQTAWFALHRLTDVAPDDTVVVHGAAGGLGTACVRLAVTAGARVIATAHGDAKTARRAALGADIALDTAALATTDGDGPDALVEGTTPSVRTARGSCSIRSEASLRGVDPLRRFRRDDRGPRRCQRHVRAGAHQPPAGQELRRERPALGRLPGSADRTCAARPRPRSWSCGAPAASSTTSAGAARSPTSRLCSRT